MNQNKYDVVIKAKPQDYHKLALVVSSLDFLNPTPQNIYIISPTGYQPKGTVFDSKIVAVRDDEVTPRIDKSRLIHRPNWNWVNLVSILQEFTENDLYLDIQSDNFFTRPIDLFDESGRPKIFQSTANDVNNNGHRPYFTFSEKVFGIEKVSYGYSYIIEFLMYDRRLLRQLFDERFKSYEDMIETVYANVTNDSYPADQEIFGNLVERYHHDKYCFVPNTQVCFHGSFQEVDVNSLEAYINNVKQNNPNAIACSYHTWIW